MSKTIVEFQIPLPFTVEEYGIGKLYSVIEASKHETGGGEGIEILVNEPYEGEDKYHYKGQFTHKVFHLSSKVPRLIRMLAPKGSLEIHEKSWNAYPYCRTIYTNPDYMKDGFHIIIESVHKPGRPEGEKNEHSAEAIIIDIVNDPVPLNAYSEDEDPSKFHSIKTGRGPLSKDWLKGNQDYPIMTCFKRYEIEFKWWGLQLTVQNRIKAYVPQLLRKFQRQMFCWMDRWHGLTIEDIRKLENEAKEELDQMREK